MDAVQALAAHRTWMDAFCLALAEGRVMDPGLPGSGHCCRVGAWLSWRGLLSSGHLPGFQICLDAHAALHQAAADVLAALQSQPGQPLDALIGRQSAFQAAAEAMSDSLARLFAELPNPTPSANTFA